MNKNYPSLGENPKPKASKPGFNKLNKEEIDKDEYVKSLENLLIFMCKSYDEIETELVKLAEKDNETLFKVPLIQGTFHKVNIHQLGQIKFESPLYNFKDIKNEILRKKYK